MPHSTNRPSLASWLGLLLVAAAVALASCGDTTSRINTGIDDTNGPGESSEQDPSETDGPGTVKQGIHLREGIEVFHLTEKESKDVLVNQKQRRAQAVGTAADKVDGAEAGDVVMGDGFVYRITGNAARANDGAVVFDVGRFGLADVVWGDWNLDIPLDLQPGDSFAVDEDGNLRTIQQDQEVEDQIPTLSFDQDSTPFLFAAGFGVDGQADFSSDFSASFEGKIPRYESSDNYTCHNPQIDTCIGFGFFCKQATYCVDELSVRAELGADVTMNFKVKAQAAGQILDKGGEVVSKPLGRIPLGTTPFALYPSFYIKAGAAANAQGKTEIDVDPSGSARIPLGFEYINGQGVTPFPNENTPIQTDFSMPYNTEFSAGAYGKVFVEAGLEFRLGSTVTQAVTLHGPQAGGELRGQAEWKPWATDPNATPKCFLGQIFFGPSFGGKVQLDANLGRWSWTKNLSGSISYTPESLRIPIHEVRDNGATCLGEDMPTEDDQDGDGLPDDREREENTDPTKADTDGDGHEDGPEVSQGTDPNDPNNYPGSSGHGQSCQVQANCQSQTLCFAGTCVDKGKARFSLSWQAYTDLDLHVKTPNGKHIHYRHRDADGGRLDVDGCVTHGCNEDKQTYVENVRWKGDNAPTGTYEFWVVNFNGKNAAQFDLETSINGKTQNLSGSLPAKKEAESQRWTVEVK